MIDQPMTMKYPSADTGAEHMFIKQAVKKAKEWVLQ